MKAKIMRQSFAKPKRSQTSYWISLSGQSTELEEAEKIAQQQLERPTVTKSRSSDDGHTHKPLAIAKQRLPSDLSTAVVHLLPEKQRTDLSALYVISASLSRREILLLIP